MKLGKRKQQWNPCPGFVRLNSPLRCLLQDRVSVVKLKDSSCCAKCGGLRPNTSHYYLNPDSLNGTCGFCVALKADYRAELDRRSREQHREILR